MSKLDPVMTSDGVEVMSVISEGAFVFVAKRGDPSYAEFKITNEEYTVTPMTFVVAPYAGNIKPILIKCDLFIAASIVRLENMKNIKLVLFR